MSGETFGAMLRGLRQAKVEQLRRANGRASWDNAGSISQTELSLRAGLDPACVNKLESGVNHPNRATVLKLAEALEVDEAITDRLLIAGGYWPWELGDEQVTALVEHVRASPARRPQLRSRAV